MAIQINAEIMEYMVWIVEIISAELFNNNKSVAYKILNDYEIWDIYVQNYDVTHTLSADYILQEVKEILTDKGVL